MAHGRQGAGLLRRVRGCRRRRRLRLPMRAHVGRRGGGEEDPGDREQPGGEAQRPRRRGHFVVQDAGLPSAAQDGGAEGVHALLRLRQESSQAHLQDGRGDVVRGGSGAQEGGGDRRCDAAGGAAERLQGQARPALDATTTMLVYGPVDRRCDMQ